MARRRIGQEALGFSDGSMRGGSSLDEFAALADESKLTLRTDTGEYEFSVEVVDTPESQAKGLMYATELADDAD